MTALFRETIRKFYRITIVGSRRMGEIETFVAVIITSNSEGAMVPYNNLDLILR